MPALVPIRFGSSPEGTPKRPLIAGITSVVPPPSCVVGPVPGPTPFDGLNPTGIYSVSRKLKSAFVGSLYVVDGSMQVDTLYDQSGNGRNLGYVGSPLNSPVVGCFGDNIVSAMQFTAPKILRGGAFGNFVTATDGYIIATVRVTAIFANPNHNTLIASNWPLNNAGLYIPTTGTQIEAWNNDGEHVEITIALDTVYVVEWRHESGSLYLRINGAGEVLTGAGAMNGFSLSEPLNFGGRFIENGLTGSIFEAGFFSVVPNLATRDALVQDMGTWVGAAV